MKHIFLFLILGLLVQAPVTGQQYIIANDHLEITIGSGQQYPEQVRMPFDFDWRNSVSQSLYYPDEIGISRGMLGKLTYFKNFQNNIPEKEIKIWMGETTLEHLSGGWIPVEELTLVFDGLLDFPSGPGTINIDLDQPYEYNGGVLVIYSNRVFEQNYYSFNDRFFASPDEGKFRTRQLNDDTPIDPLNPPMGANYLLDWHPNTVLSFPLDHLGGIEGVVTDGANPLEGVEISITGTTAGAFTDENGAYSIPLIMADIYDIEVSKVGYITQLIQNVAISGGQVIQLDVILQAAGQYMVFGMVTDSAGNAVAAAHLQLDGLINYETTSAGNGQFSFDAVLEGNYSLKVTADGYEDVTLDNVQVSGGDVDLGAIMLPEIIIDPIGLTAETDLYEPGSAFLNWYHAPQRTFRWDDGTYAYWIGVDGDMLNVFGTVYRNDAVLTEISWYLASDNGLHNEVALWIFGLNENLEPDNEELLFFDPAVPNVDDQWSTHVFDFPVPAPNGFLVGISFDGILSLGTDDGESQEWPFQYNTHYFTGDVTSENFAPIESFGNFYWNFLIRAYGIDNGELTAKKNSNVSDAKPEIHPPIIYRQLQQPVVLTDTRPLQPSNHSLSGFQEFNIYLNDLLIPYGQTNETTFLITGLAAGAYTAGVEAVYATGNSQIVTVEFETDGITSVTDLNYEMPKVYPNPFGEVLYITQYQNVHKVIFTSVCGKTAHTMIVAGAKGDISTKNLPSGVYLVQLISRGKTLATFKMIKN